MDRGELEAACAALATLYDDPDSELAARAQGLGGRCELRRGNLDSALGLLERSSKLAASLGLRVAATPTASWPVVGCGGAALGYTLNWSRRR